MALYMDLTTTIECREKNSNSFANGDYETILAEPVLLQPGDQVMLKTASIDTANTVEAVL